MLQKVCIKITTYSKGIYLSTEVRGHINKSWFYIRKNGNSWVNVCSKFVPNNLHFQRTVPSNKRLNSEPKWCIVSPTVVLIRSHGNRKPWSWVSWVHLVVLNPSPAGSYLRCWLHLALSYSSGLLVLRDRQWLRSNWRRFFCLWMLCVWSAGFDLKEILQCRPSDVAKKKQRSLDVTVNPKITLELDVSAYSEVARWLKPVTGTFIAASSLSFRLSHTPETKPFGSIKGYFAHILLFCDMW